MFEWLKKESADFVCLQEVRAQLDDIQGEAFWPNNYHCYHHVAVRKGYSGVAIFTKLKPNNVIEGLGCKEFDAEGRYIECEFDDFSLASAYFPSGSSGDQRQEAKYRFLDLFKDKLEAVNLQNKGYLFCGDVNIVHQEIDITNLIKKKGIALTSLNISNNLYTRDSPDPDLLIFPSTCTGTLVPGSSQK